MSDDDVLEFLDYPGYFSLMRLKLPANKRSILEKFKEERLITERNNKYNITNLGGILFARELSAFEELSRKAVRVIIYKGKN